MNFIQLILFLISGFCWAEPVSEATTPQESLSQATETHEVPVAEEQEASLVSGQIQFEYAIGLRPQGSTNVSRFGIDQVLVDFKKDVHRRYRLFAQLQGGQRVNDNLDVDENHGHESAEGFGTRILQAYVNADGSWRFGLIPDPWIARHREDLATDLLGSFGRSLEEQFGIQEPTDLGVSYQFIKPNWNVSLALFNGGGLGRKETGVSKDGQLTVGLRYREYRLILSRTQGFYDNLPQKKAKKNRSRVAVSIDWDFLQIYGYHIFAEDTSSRAIQDKLFAGVYLAGSREIMHSFGDGGLVRFRFLQRHELFYHRSQWNPEKAFDGNELTDQVAGWIYDDGIRWAISWHQRVFAKKTFNGITPQDAIESVYLSTSFKF